MAISKITLNGEVQMDVTQDTVTANNLLSGETATGADGVRLTGTLIPSSEPVLQAKTVTPTSSEQVIVPDGYACTPSVYTSNAQSYSAGAQINSSVFFYSGSLIEEQTYRVLGRLDVVDASGTVLEYYDIDSEFIWNTTYQDVLINGATEYVQCLKLGKGSAYNQVKLFLKLNLAGTFGFTLKIYFYEENASYDGLSQVTVNPIPSQYIVPSGTKTITENGTGIDVASYASVDVNVAGQSGQYITLYFDIQSNETITVILSGTALSSTIDWGDGNITENPSSRTVYHTYKYGGFMPVRISGSSVDLYSYAFGQGTTAALTNTNLIGVEYSGSGNLYESAFENCAGLETVILHKTLSPDIGTGKRAFYKCTSIKHVYIAEGVTHISTNMFYMCSAVKSVIIPSSITAIGSYAFSGCSLLETVHVLPITPPTLNNGSVFNNNAEGRVIYVPYSADHSILAAYQSAANWSNYASEMQEEPQ